MKKLFVVLAMILMFSSTMVVNAEEVISPKLNSEDRFNDFLTELEGKQVERNDQINSKWSERQENKQLRNVNFLELVTTYAPDLLSDFETAFDTHDALHQELFALRMASRNAYTDETITALTTLKETLFAQATAGDITWKEAFQSLKTLRQESKTTFQSSRSDYRASILAANTEWKVKAAEIKALRQELNVAIEADDAETANQMINELYDYLLQHIEFDQLKLDMMKSMF